MKISVAILGATGYTGSELIRLIGQHPHFSITHLAAHSQAGKRLDEVLPGVPGATGQMILAASDAPLPEETDLVFTALPHGAAAESVKRALDAGCKVVDLSADFRHQTHDIYKAAYQTEHPYPELFDEAVFGLSEFNNTAIAKARLIANPGCYPTSVLLPLVPLAKAGMLDSAPLIIDSKTGVSGAGRSAKTDLLFCEIDESVKPYGLPRHRHVWEMEEWLESFAGKEFKVRFVPHLLPMNRGMLSTLHLSGEQPDTWHSMLKSTFAGQPFVRVLPEGKLPSTKGVTGSNRCDIGVQVIGPREAVIVSCIDNLLKGASGQAIQNANLMFGLDQTLGLDTHALWP